jgi:hypothetical protein
MTPFEFLSMIIGMTMLAASITITMLVVGAYNKRKEIKRLEQDLHKLRQSKINQAFTKRRG